MPLIYLMQAEQSDEAEVLDTDGMKLYYNPEGVVRSYLEEKQSICRRILHIVLHGMLGHFTLRGTQAEGNDEQDLS